MNLDERIERILARTKPARTGTRRARKPLKDRPAKAIGRGSESRAKRRGPKAPVGFVGFAKPQIKNAKDYIKVKSVDPTIFIGKEGVSITRTGFIRWYDWKHLVKKIKLNKEKLNG